jgi:hypothetical protein
MYWKTSGVASKTNSSLCHPEVLSHVVRYEDFSACEDTENVAVFSRG